MKITLVTMDQMIVSYGVRCMSSYLKANGFDVSIIFARCLVGKQLPDAAAADIAALCAESDIIGISLMSNHYIQAAALTRVIRASTELPVYWGGIHPTFCPEESLQHADAVCIGEGEIPFLELCNKIKRGVDITDTPGFWFRSRDGVVKNTNYRMVTDLDSLPNPDYGPEHHFIRDGERIRPLTAELFNKFLTKRKNTDGEYMSEYYISTSRGCPFKCSYCSSHSIKQLYPDQKFFRSRSLANVITEVKELIEKYNFIHWIYFADDDFFAAPLARTVDFCNIWKREISLPFYCTCSPFTYNAQKMRALVDAGLMVINMGIQSVSQAGGKSFNRLIPHEKIWAAIRSINQFTTIHPPVYDFILDNPYESDADRLENLRFMIQIPKPRTFQQFSLVPFPGTEIFNRMTADGLIVDPHKEIYMKSYSYPKQDYLNLLFFLTNINIPPVLLVFASSRIMIILFHNPLAKLMFKILPYSFIRWIAHVFVHSEFWAFNRDVYE